jgi:hypothetical protein
MINTKLQNIIDTKSAIGNAIVNKGGTITGATPFLNYASEIDNISTGPSAYNGWAVQDVSNAKYTAYNGIIDGTSGGNNTYAFNRWLLDNSTTNSILLANTVMQTSADVIVNITGTNEANLAFIANTATLSTTQFISATNNGFLYGQISFNGNSGAALRRFYESNLAIESNGADYGGYIYGITINNGFIYLVGSSNTTVKKYHESNLAFVGNTANYGGTIWSVTTNNGFIYAGGQTNQRVQKFHEGNLAFVGNTNNYGGTIYSVTTNNGFIYAGGDSNQRVQKFHESNLTFVNNTVAYGATIKTIAVNNSFIYAGGGFGGNHSIQKYHESNLVLDSNVAYGQTIEQIVVNDSFIYAAGAGNATANRDVKKYHESNLVLLANTTNYGGTILAMAVNNNSIYVGGGGNDDIKKYQAKEITFNNTALYEIKSLKED